MIMSTEAIDYVSQWVPWLLLLVPGLCVTRITYLGILSYMTSDDSKIADCKNKISTTIKGGILAESIVGIITVIKSFYV